MRLFVSVDLPAHLTGAVADAQDRFRGAGGLRFVAPDQAHVTLKFLGEVDAARVDDLTDALETAVDDAGVTPFEATVGGFGVFPSLDYISVVWAGFREGGESLTRLHDAVERETVAIGFDPEDHDYTPHVTIARMEDARGKESVQRVVRDADPTIGSFTVGEVRLTESTLTPDGPEYRTVAGVAL